MRKRAYYLRNHHSIITTLIALFILFGGHILAQESPEEKEKAIQDGIRKLVTTLREKYAKEDEQSLDKRRKFEEAKDRALSGKAEDQYKLALCFESGLGVRKDYVQAASWYLKAAEQDHDAAQGNLAALLSAGLGVPKNTSKALYWYKKSAEQDWPFAQNDLGNLYANGNEVSKDLIEAYAYFSLAGKIMVSSRESLANLKKQMTEEECSRGEKRCNELKKRIDAKVEFRKKKDGSGQGRS